MGKKPETVFKERVMSDLQSLPRSWFEKIQQRAKAGTPDFLGCVAGWFIALELKKDDDTEPDVLQTYKLHKISKAGGFSFIVSPENWNEVLIELHRLALNPKEGRQ